MARRIKAVLTGAAKCDSDLKPWDQNDKLMVFTFGLFRRQASDNRSAVAAGELLESGPMAMKTKLAMSRATSVKTYMAKPADVEPKWWLVDAADKVVGRLASDIAVVLMGKHRPTYTPHVDNGDWIVVVNADKVVLSGKKWEQKRYTWTTYYPGLRSENAAKRFAREPEMILIEAVRRMLPKNKLAYKLLNKLKVYTGSEHPHQAQEPEPREMGKK